MIRIAIFASGNGTNAENIIKYFARSTIAKVVLILSNNKDSKVLERSKSLNIKTLTFTKDDLYGSNKLNKTLFEKADFIVLAGFLWKIPASLIHLFPKKIINIHPALLPKYGGKGMYGIRVHQAVKGNNEKETGITIHFVNEHYDEGSIIFQKKVTIIASDSPLDIAKKIHELEQQYFPIVIDNLLQADK